MCVSVVVAFREDRSRVQQKQLLQKSLSRGVVADEEEVNTLAEAAVVCVCFPSSSFYSFALSFHCLTPKEEATF